MVLGILFEETMKLEFTENGTQLNVHSQMKIGGFFKIAVGFVGKQVQKQGVADFGTLKRLLEEGQA